MLFTGKGDGGTMKTFGCNQRVSKSSAVSEALGSLDEINSFLGWAKVKSKDSGFRIVSHDLSFESLVHRLQKDLFIIQAELAGAPEKTIEEGKVKHIEGIINSIETTMPPIHSFFISGGTELAACFDVARTIARRAERRVVAANEEGSATVGKFSLAYLNRLSSILYALARLSNHLSGITEEPPDYK